MFYPTQLLLWLYALTEEFGVSATIDKFNMRFDVSVTFSTVGDLEDFPWIKPSDYIQALATHGEFGKLLGGKTLEQAAPMLQTFWNRFKELVPHHEVFQASLNDGDYSKYIPLYCHGDEGTGYKKKGVLCIAFQPVIGWGSRRAQTTQACRGLSKKPVQ